MKIYFDSPVTLTDGHRYFDYNGETYSPGKLLINQTIVQKSAPTASSFALTISAVDQTMVSVFASQNYKGVQCKIIKAYLDDVEQIVKTEVFLDGDLNKYSYKNGLKDSTLKVTVSSVFAAFESVKALNLNTIFADTINADDTIYWGKKSNTSSVRYKRNPNGKPEVAMK